MLLINATRSVKVPTRPKNMVQIITTFPAVLREVVIPTVKPTVLYAEKLSKASAVRPLSPSVIVRIKIDIPSQIRDNEMIAKAFLTDSSEISLRKMWILL